MEVTEVFSWNYEAEKSAVARAHLFSHEKFPSSEKNITGIIIGAYC